MSSRIARLLGLFAGLTAVALLCAAQAGAAGTWTVKAGSATAGTTVKITGKTVGTSPQVHFRDATTNQTLTCTSATAPGTTVVGSGRSGTGIGHINGAKTTWTGCAGPAGLKFTVTGINPGGHAWSLNAGSFAAPVTKGSITGVKATVSDPGVCSFTVTGKVPANYSNKTHSLFVLNTQSTLTISGVSGCLGLINNNDKAAFKATYALKANNPAFNPITITSP